MKNYLTCVLCIFLMSSVVAEDIKGIVTKVHDGDTYYMRTSDGTEVKVRQLYIDAPEATQPFGDISKDFSTYLLVGRTVVVHTNKKDLYGRTLGSTEVLIGDKWYSAERLMLSNGLAWHYERYDSNKELSAIEDVARANRRGLWIEDYPTPPWQYRNDKKRK